MSHKSLFVLVSQKIDERNLERFGYKIFKKKGWKIKTIFLGNSPKEYVKKSTKLKKIIYVKKSKDALRVSRNIKNSVIYNLCNETFLQTIFNLFLLYNKNILVLRYDVIPFQYILGRNFSTFFRRDFFKKFCNIFSLIFIRFLNNSIYYYYNKNILNCITGKKSINKIKYFLKNKVFTHTYDYDFYLKDKNARNYSNNIVFIDQYEENHPDYKRLKIRTVTKKNYFSSLNHFFKVIEKKFKKKIIIAGHPRAYRDKTRDFGGRKIIYNNTYKLIKNSHLVIAHDSTSLNFACLLKKPVLLTYTDEMKKSSYLMNSILSFSEALGVKTINIDELTEKKIKINLRFNNKKYEEFIENYITLSKSKKLNHEILEQKFSKFI